VALLCRVEAKVAEGGRVVVDLADHGAGVTTGWVTIETPQGSSEPLPWAWVGADAIATVASEARLVPTVHEHDGRWFAVLEREP
jgi:hypothetical protein